MHHLYMGIGPLTFSVKFTTKVGRTNIDLPTGTIGEGGPL